MKETVSFVKQYFREGWDVAKLQWKSFVMAILIIAFFYVMSLIAPPGWVSYLFCVPPAFVVAITALARVNDIGPERMGRRWEFRKISLIMVGTGAVMVLVTPFTESPAFPTWRGVILMWGFAGAWMTTPGMPPWDYYVTGAYRFLTHPPDVPRSPLQRFVGRITGPLSTEEVLRAQAEWEAERKKSHSSTNTRRGDGVDP